MYVYLPKFLTTVSGDHYFAVLMFAVNDTRVCHNMSTLNDFFCEGDPIFFFSDLAYFSGIQPITVMPVTTTVVIFDSSDPECK